MEALSIIISLLPYVVKLMNDAERIYSGAKQGAVKKSYVMDALATLLGDSPHKNMVLKTISPLIDSIVAIYNLTGWWGRKVNLDIGEGGQL